ncbi:MAG TPA: hypothetical protein VI451_08130 [Anaerolineales bacterium]|nr:hypothetical protein [Anaerolineales bacterium]
MFLLSAFAPHVWTIILVLRDFGWISERTNAWDALGAGAYGLLFAFVESFFVFVIALILGLFVSRHWEERTRLALLCVLLLVVALWEVFGQLYFMWGLSVPAEAIRFLASNEHPLRNIYSVALIFIVTPVLFLVYLVLSSQKMVQVIEDWIDRITLLVTMYLILDLVALVIVVFRNVNL